MRLRIIVVCVVAFIAVGLVGAGIWLSAVTGIPLRAIPALLGPVECDKEDGATPGAASLEDILGGNREQDSPSTGRLAGSEPGGTPAPQQTERDPATASQPPAGRDGKLDAILDEYRPRFLALERDYKAKLDTLLAEAISEYKRCKSDKAKLISLAPGYVRRGYALERQADADFTTLVASFRRELKANSLPTAIADQIERHYRAMKNEKRRELSQLARQAIPGLSKGF